MVLLGFFCELSTACQELGPEALRNLVGPNFHDSGALYIFFSRRKLLERSAFNGRKELENISAQPGAR